MAGMAKKSAGKRTKKAKPPWMPERPLTPKDLAARWSNLAAEPLKGIANYRRGRRPNPAVEEFLIERATESARTIKGQLTFSKEVLGPGISKGELIGRIEGLCDGIIADARKKDLGGIHKKLIDISRLVGGIGFGF